MQNFDLGEGDDIDPDDLVDHYIRAEVVHTKQPSRKDPTKTLTFANLGDKSPADGFETAATPSAMSMGKTRVTASKPAHAAPAPSGGLDLKSLLG